MSEAVIDKPQAELTLTPPAAVPARPTRFVIPDDPKPEPAASPAPEKPAAVENTEEQAPSDEPKVEKTENDPEQEAKRQGRRFERRLGAAYRKAAEAQARAELLEKQLNEQRQASAPKISEGEPTLAQFDFDPEKYAEAKANFAKTQAAKEFEAKQREAAQKAAQSKMLSAWEEKAERGADKYDDWTEVVGELKPDSPFTAAIIDADNGDDIAHYLGKHPKEAKRIAELPPLSQVREIGKLEAKLSAKPVEPKTPSKAPAPITPVTGTTPAANNEPSEQDDMAAWMRKREKQLASRRR